MSAVDKRTTIYLSPVLMALCARANAAGETISGEITTTIERYEATLRRHVPTALDAGQLHIVRSLLSGNKRLPFDTLSPRVFAAIIEDAAEPGRDDPTRLRLIYSTARAVAQLDAIEVIALVESVERWARRVDSVAADPLEREFYVSDER